MNKKTNNQGFTLLEMLLYLGILGIVAGLFVGILTVTTRVQVHEVANNEVSSQLNFVMQTIQRTVRESSNIEEVGADNDDTPIIEISYLKLRMKDDLKDPTCISLLPDENIYMTQGNGVNPLGDCDEPGVNDLLITDSVKSLTSPIGLSFEKRSNPPGHDSVNINLTLDFNTTDPQSQVSRTIQSAIGRASAATFDDRLLPNLDNTLDIGGFSQYWKNLYLSGIIEQEGNFGGGRGEMIVGGGSSESCGSICQNHGLACSQVLSFTDQSGAFVLTPVANGCNDGSTIGGNDGGLCFCN